ncbi:chemotaxis protein CheW [Pelomonas sp. V22]|uniref:chemotaxis protein CheW n=1 Tax=Pelomonas sp. V22 TaxID=2822139 RepID=UPI0024A842F2|nr:chemotaxis protein CheW [Pelomonas sp. V22]MDI4635913.1 chemotaxis protein CheW [Pelomonas sp. V22]
MDIVASPLNQSPTRAIGGEYLSFRLGQEEYGIEILLVQEIRGYEPATRIAGAPEYVHGVLNLRGVIVPIVDLRLKLGLAAEFDPFTVTVVMNLGGRTVGAVVDAVADVLELLPAQIQPAPEFSSSLRATHITGLGTVRQGSLDRMLILLDIAALLSDDGLLGMAT